MTVDITEEEKKLIKDVFDSVGGPLFEEEGQFLYEIAKKVKDGAIVEIGSAHGRSTICLALGSKAGYNTPVYSVDPRTGQPYTVDVDWIEHRNPESIGTPDIEYYTQQNTGYQEFYVNIKKWKVDDIVIPISNYSELAYKNGLDGHKWNKDIGLLWIDADHRYNYVKLDIELWAKHVINGGKILFHDYPYFGVKKAIGELILGNSRYHHFRGVGLDPIANVTVKQS